MARAIWFRLSTVFCFPCGFVCLSLFFWGVCYCMCVCFFVLLDLCFQLDLCLGMVSSAVSFYTPIRSCFIYRRESVWILHRKRFWLFFVYSLYLIFFFSTFLFSWLFHVSLPLSIKAARCNKRSVNPTVRQEPRAAAAAAGTCCRCLAGQSTLDIFFSLLYNNNFQDVHAVLRNIYYDSNRCFFYSMFGKDMCVCVSVSFFR